LVNAPEGVDLCIFCSVAESVLDAERVSRRLKVRRFLKLMPLLMVSWVLSAQAQTRSQEVAADACHQQAADAKREARAIRDEAARVAKIREVEQVRKSCLDKALGTTRPPDQADPYASDQPRRMKVWDDLDREKRNCIDTFGRNSPEGQRCVESVHKKERAALAAERKADADAEQTSRQVRRCIDLAKSIEAFQVQRDACAANPDVGDATALRQCFQSSFEMTINLSTEKGRVVDEAGLLAKQCPKEFAAAQREVEDGTRRVAARKKEDEAAEEARAAEEQRVEDDAQARQRQIAAVTQARKDPLYRQADLAKRLCDRYTELALVGDAQRQSARIDAASGTVNLGERRKIAAYKIAVEDQISELKRVYKNAGGTVTGDGAKVWCAQPLPEKIEAALVEQIKNGARAAPASPIAGTGRSKGKPIQCGTAAWSPFREAVVDYCSGAGKSSSDCPVARGYFTKCRGPMGATQPLDQPASGTEFEYVVDGEEGIALTITFKKNADRWTVKRLGTVGGE